VIGMTTQQDGPLGPPLSGPEAEGDLEGASVPELIVQLAQTEDEIRRTAQGGGPSEALARREEEIVQALRRQHGPASRPLGGPDAQARAPGGPQTP
jgi:hypothetical protein